MQLVELVPWDPRQVCDAAAAGDGLWSEWEPRPHRVVQQKRIVFEERMQRLDVGDSRTNQTSVASVVGCRRCVGTSGE